MTEWEAVFLGFLQGATEFLPVSSSGHLVLGQTILGIEIPGVLFEVTVHVATLLSIVVAYRARLGTVAVGAVRGDAKQWRYLGLLVVATLPAAAIGLLWREPIEALFETRVTVGVALIVTGCLLWSTRNVLRRRGREEGEDGEGRAGEGEGDWADVALLSAVVMGFAQAFALIPGISRSGSTVVAALWLGVAPAEAAAFSFLMALPAIGGAAVLQAPDVVSGGLSIPVLVLAVGGVAAALTGILAIRTFVAMLKNRSFHTFGVYCWVVGGLFLAYLGWLEVVG